jgi:hypothetical protein
MIKKNADRLVSASSMCASTGMFAGQDGKVERFHA